MSVTQKVTLYNNKFTVPPVINAVQNDTDRLIEAYFGDFTLQVGMTGVLSFIRSDRTHYEVPATLDTATNTATAELDQALTQAGVTQAQLKITDSGNVGSTFTFMIKVQPDVAGISQQQDGWSAQEFDQRLTDAENAIDAVEEDVADLQDKEYDYAPVITDTASGAIASFPDGADNYPMRSVVAYINPAQAGTGDPSPDNVRPISGWSEAKVTRTGKNLLDESIGHNWSIYWAFGSSGTGSNVPDGTLILNAGTYTVSADKICTVISVRTSETAEIARANNVTSVQFTLSERKAIKVGITSDNSPSKFQIELGSTATDYEPYNGQTFTISLGDTRYGGTLDVTRGKLRVTHGYLTDNGTLNWVRNDNGSFYVHNPSATAVQSADGCSCNYAPFVISFDGMAVFFRTNGLISLGKGWGSLYATVDALKSAFASMPIQFVYKLATPVEVDLTPTEITTLLGINNLWSDTGDVEVEYCCSTRLFIEKKLAELMA